VSAELTQALRGIPVETVRGRRTITRRHHTSRIPRTPEEKRAPLHIATVDPMDVEGIVELMNAETQTRFRSVWRLLFTAPANPSQDTSVYPPSTLTAPHALQLCNAEVIEAADGPGHGQSTSFTVLEEKNDEFRQRFILWTASANYQVTHDGYKADVPLGHVSQYLNAVRSECASGRDLRTSFFQVEIPPASRYLFRFVDATGNWWQMRRLPMGHSCSVEIMHTLVSTLAGHSRYVRSDLAETDVQVDTWVDNVRFTGDRAAVAAASRRLDDRALKFRVSWKPQDTFNTATKYDYVGVQFDHARQTVRPSRKISTKIRDFVRSLGKDGPSEVRASEIESMTGRLLHASSIAGVSPGNFYFTLKFARRIVNALNRGVSRPDDRIPLPPSAVRGLKDWAAATLLERKMPATPHVSSHTVFVDASNTGWGVVVANDSTGEIKILGDTWTTEESEFHINVLEAWALAEGVLALPPEAQDTRVRFLVDNTTVQHCTRKGMCIRNRHINDAVVFCILHLQTLAVSFTVGYIKSALNPADLPSRVRLSRVTPENRRSVEGQVRQFFGC
jgi:hypothetical protein